jgi:hypothetical protein
MKLPELEESYLQGPLVPSEPHDPYERSVLNHAEYGEDLQRERYVHTLLTALPRPLTLRERRAAVGDQGVPPRVYAPAALRVSKLPHPWDAEILEEGRRHTVTAEAALHPGDCSDPGELR